MGNSGWRLCFGNGLAQEPSLKKWHKAIHMFAAGDHLVNTPMRRQASHDAVGIAQFGLAESVEDLRDAR